MFVPCGYTGIEFKLTVVETLFRATSVQGFWVYLYILAMDPKQRQEVMAEVFDLFRWVQWACNARFCISRSFCMPLSDCGHAHCS